MIMIWSFRAFFFSSRRRHTRSLRDWSSDVCSSDLQARPGEDDVEPVARCFSLIEHRIIGHRIGARDEDHHVGRDVVQRSESTRLNSSHVEISYAVFCLKKKNDVTQQCLAYPHYNVS